MRSMTLMPVSSTDGLVSCSSKGGGVRSDVSIHLWFDYDVTAFRFVLRIGGRPWWNGPANPATGNLTLSPYIALGSR